MEKETIVKFVCDSATEVFATMLGIEISAESAYEEQQTQPASERVVSLIGLAGSWMGSGMLSCSPEFACKISSLMLMSEFDSVNGDVLDAMGEMANMIFGNVKTQLEERLGPLGLSIPTVIFGRNFSTKSIGSQSWMVVPIKADSHSMEIKMCLTPNHAADAPAGRAGHVRQFSLQD